MILETPKIHMTQALYRKWRPLNWDQVVGQEHVVQTLRNAVVAGRVAHAYLFAGPRGTGKTTTARILAKAVNCLEDEITAHPCNQCEYCLAVNQARFLDLIEIDAASNTSVDDVRDLREKINFSPNQGRYKVYIIDEVHMLSTAAFNALLKTLEEPPNHAIFVLATTEIHKIPATVLSRCQRHEFRRIPLNSIITQLKEIAADESISVDDQALSLVARQSTGSLRDAISLLDQLASTGQEITLDLAQTVLGTAASQSVLDLIDALLLKDAAAGLDTIHRTLDGGSDPRQFGRQVVDYLRNLLLVRMGNASQVDATTDLRAQIARHAQGFDVPGLLNIIKTFNYAANDARSAWQPALPLEMAFVESINSMNSEPIVQPVIKEKPKEFKQAQQPSQKLKEERLQKLAPELDADQSDQSVADSPEGAVTLKLVRDNWEHMLGMIRQHNPQTEALLRSSRLLGVKNGAVYFGFSEVLKTRMEKSENMKTALRVFQEVLKVEVPIRCVVSTGRAGKLPPDVDGDGMVAAALRDLGGEIVDVQ